MHVCLQFLTLHCTFFTYVNEHVSFRTNSIAQLTLLNRFFVCLSVLYLLLPRIFCVNQRTQKKKKVPLHTVPMCTKKFLTSQSQSQLPYKTCLYNCFISIATVVTPHVNHRLNFIVIYNTAHLVCWNLTEVPSTRNVHINKSKQQTKQVIGNTHHHHQIALTHLT